MLRPFDLQALSKFSERFRDHWIKYYMYAVKRHRHVNIESQLFRPKTSIRITYKELQENHSNGYLLL